MINRKRCKMKVQSVLMAVTIAMPMIFGNASLAIADEVADEAVVIENIDGESASEEELILTDDGDAEDTSTYKQIKTIADLYAINNDLSGKYILMNDIDMSATDGGDWDPEGYGWEPIGLDANVTGGFGGVFDGNGHKIRNLTIKGDKNKYVGLFARFNKATIRNLGIENVNIKCQAEYFGGIVGEAYESIIEKCYVTGNIEELDKPPFRYYIGGIVGQCYNGGSLKDCFTSVNIKSKGSEAGGVCCMHSWYQDLANCYAVKSVTTTGDGIIGMISPYKNYNCYFLNLDGEIRTDPSAKPLSAVMMKTESSFTGFDFDNVWCIDAHAPNNNFPQLRSCLQDPIKSIQITKEPTVKEYNTISTNLLLDGGKLTINYEDGTVVTDVDMNEAKAKYSFLPAGKQTVTIDYCGKTATYDIDVKKAEPTIEGEMEFIKKVGDAFALTHTTDSDGTITYDYGSVADKSIIKSCCQHF